MNESNARQIPIFWFSPSGQIKTCRNCQVTLQIVFPNSTETVADFVEIEDPDTGQQKTVCLNCWNGTKVYEGWKVLQRNLRPKV